MESAGCYLWWNWKVRTEIVFLNRPKVKLNAPEWPLSKYWEIRAMEAWRAMAEGFISLSLDYDMTWAHYTGRQVPTFYSPSFLHSHQSVLKTSAAAVLVTRTPQWKSLLMEGTSKAASVRLLSETKAVENGEREKKTLRTIALSVIHFAACHFCKIWKEKAGWFRWN